MKQLKIKNEVLVLKPGIQTDKLHQQFTNLYTEICSIREDFLDSSYCNDAKLFSLYEQWIELIKENTTTKEIEKECFQQETIDEIKQKCGKRFISELKELFKNKYAIHATNIADPSVFFEDAFRIYGSNELVTTTYASVGSIENLLFLLFNRMHLGLTKIVVLDANQDDVVKVGEIEPYKCCGYIPKQFIKAYIDLDNMKIIYNSHYKERLVNGKNEFINKNTYVNKPLELKFKRDYFEKAEKDFDFRYLADVEISLYADLVEVFLLFPDEDGYLKELDKQSIDYAVKVLNRLKKIDIQKYREEYLINV